MSDAGDFLILVLEINPNLRNDWRLTTELITSLLYSFQVRTTGSKEINLDRLTSELAEGYNLPVSTIGPMIELMIVGSSEPIEYYRVCPVCRSHHVYDEPQCNDHDLVVKLPIGFIVLTDDPVSKTNS